MAFNTIEHTADLAVRVTAREFSALFSESAAAMTSLMVHPETLSAKETIPVAVEGEDRVDLLINWLRELLYLWHGRELLVAKSEILEIGESNLRARIRCDRYDPNRHEISHELKAVTYHDARVEAGRDGWEAWVVFDV